MQSVIDKLGYQSVLLLSIRNTDIIRGSPTIGFLTTGNTNHLTVDYHGTPAKELTTQETTFSEVPLLCPWQLHATSLRLYK